MFIKIVVALVIVVAALLIFAQTRPSHFHYERSATIKAPAAKIFALIDNLHNWPAWSPYEKLDPAMKKTYSGPLAGKGAAYAWEGNTQIGAGRLEIAGSTEPSSVRMNLDLLKPFAGHNDVVFTLQPNGDATQVTWAMDGQYILVAKFIGLFMNMDKMVGGQFDEGLANLKREAER